MTQTDKYGKHEVLHVSSIIVDMFDDYICQHDVVVTDNELREKADKIMGSLCEFYQLCGKKFL